MDISEKLKVHFIDALNPCKLPSDFSKHIENNEFDKAINVAIRYFRERPCSQYLEKRISNTKCDFKTADNAVKGNITVVNIPYQFPNGKIDFLFDPTRPTTGIYNPEWQWQMNRMHFWLHMALAYKNTKDEKYAKAFAEQVYNWVTTVHCTEGWNKRGSAWRTIETGIRLMGNWPIAFEIFRASPSLTDETLALMLASMHEQALHALHHRTSKNWLMLELNGAHTFATAYPEFKLSSEIKQQSAEIINQDLKEQILPDGMQYELSPDYAYATFICASTICNIAKLEGTFADLPKDLTDNIEKLAESFIKLTTPAFIQPKTNDTYTIELPLIAKTAANLFPNRKDFIWASTKRAEGEPPKGEIASRFLPWAGFVAMRSDWGPDATYLCFDVGPLGKAHKHWDMLNINIFKGDEELVFDDGGGEYEDSEYRKYALSAHSHNTILVDGMGQMRTEPLVSTEPTDAGYISNNKFDYAFGIYDDIFGDNGEKPASHKREVLFAKPNFFVVADTMQSKDGKPHDYTMLLHLDTESVEVTSKTIRSNFGKKHDLYALTLSEGVEVAAESGQTNPLAGWYVGRTDKKLHKATTVKIKASSKKDFRFLTLLFPVENGTPLPTAEKINQTEWKITFNGTSVTLDLENLKDNASR